MGQELVTQTERQEVSTAVQRAHDCVLTTEDDMGWASEDLATLRKLRKAFKKKLDELCKPFKEGIDALKREFATMLDPLEQAERVVDQKITQCRAALRAEQDRLEREQRARAQEAERARIAAIAAHQPPPPKVEEKPVEKVAVGFATAAGRVSTMKVPKWRVTDETAIPMTIILSTGAESEPLWVLNEAAITRLRRAAGEAPSPIPGVEFYYDEVNTVR